MIKSSFEISKFEQLQSEPEKGRPQINQEHPTINGRVCLSIEEAVEDEP